MVMGVVQMNTRLDAALKCEGDAVLAELGFTPSQAVRGLWRYIIRYRSDPRRIDQVLSGGENAAEDAAARLQALERGRSICQGFEPAFPELFDAPYQEIRDALFDAEEDVRA